MGCKLSTTTKGNGTEGEEESIQRCVHSSKTDAGGSSPKSQQILEGIDLIRTASRLILEGSCAALKKRTMQPEEKSSIAASMMYSLLKFLGQNYRMKKDEAFAFLKEECFSSASCLLEIAGFAFDSNAKHVYDEFLLKLIRTWFLAIPSPFSTTIPRISLEKVHNIVIVGHLPEECGFEDLLLELLSIAESDILQQIFYTYSHGNSLMSIKDLCYFLKEGQKMGSASLKLAEERMRCRYGGYLTKYGFGIFIMSRTSNHFLQTSRSRMVWEDMTQPLTNYYIRTRCVTNIEQIRDGLSVGVRALILRCSLNEDTGEISIGMSSLEDAVMKIKIHAFRYSSYPLIIGLSPDVHLSVQVQDRIADIFKTYLGDQLAKGIMFDGLTANDPRFSPAALQGKILIMCKQSSLKQYAGFLVADTQQIGLGVRVTNVVANSPADKAGINKDDWLTHINGVLINNRFHLKTILSTLSIGQKITIRKMNLNEAYLIIGGTLVPNNEISTSLSELAFITFRVNCDLNSNCTLDGKKNIFSWDAFVCSAEDLEAPIIQEITKKCFKLIICKDAFPKINGLMKKNIAFNDVVKSTYNNDVQFFVIDANDCDAYTWDHGFFSDNAQCGYINIKDIKTVFLWNVTMELLSKPVRFGDFTLTSVDCKIYGEGEIHCENNKLIIITGANELSIASFVLNYGEVNLRGESITASFAPAMVRQGYRLLTFLPKKGVKHGVLPHTVLVKISIQKRHR